MMPDMVMSHVGSSYCDSHFPSISNANPAQQYSLYSYSHTLYQDDSSLNTYRPSPIPLPEISEFLREETRRTSDSTSQSGDTFTEFVELERKMKNDLSSVQKPTDFSNDKSGKNKKVRTKKLYSASSLSEPHKHSRKKRSKEEKLKTTKILNPCDNDRSPDYEPLSYSVVQTKVGDLGPGPEIQNFRNYNSIKPPISFSPSYADLDGPSNVPAYQSVITKCANGTLCDEKPSDVPSFTSMIFDDNIYVPSSLHVFSNTEKKLQAFSPSHQGSACQDFVYPCESQGSFMGGVQNGSEKISEPTNNVYYEMCSTNEDVAPADVNSDVCLKDEKKNLKRDMFTAKSTELVTSAEKDLNLANEKLNLFGRTNQSGLKEITWEDAKSHTQQNDLGVLPVQSNGVLEDLDLCEVDSACMEHFEREYQKEAIKEMELACSLLNISRDANNWTELQVDKWIMWTVHQCHLPAFDMSSLRMSGIELCKLGEAEMLSRVPTCGDIIHARLRIWKSASKMIDAQGKSKNRQECKVLSSQKKGEKVSKKEMENETLQATGVNSTGPHETDNSSITKPPQTSSIHLWMFLKELLLQPQMYGRFIRWIDKDSGVFKIEDSVEVARLWGVRKNRPAMNYDKLSRSIRQYYKKGIIKKTTVSQRLVYQFVNPGLSVSP